MASPVQLIYTDQPGTLPATYRVPASSEIVLSSVFARFDGGGAGSAFQPTLDLLSQNGNIIARVAVTQTLVAGDLARVTWAPFLRRQKPPGTILQAYAGQATVADFNFDSLTFVASGFPLNPTFTKLSSTSLLDIACLADFTTNATAPNCIFCGVFIDGSNQATVGMHVSLPNFFLTAPILARRGAGGSSGPPFAAGAHTIELKVAHAVGGSNSTLRSSTSVELTILEYEVS